jgi:DNA-binding beta-propeller fold protein YncE
MKQFQCGICHQIFQTPKTLPCQHTFCGQCLDKFLQNKKSKNQCLSCPRCLQLIDKIENVEQIPVDLFLQHSLNSLKETWMKTADSTPVSSPVLCSLCFEHYEEKNAACKFCKECQQPICHDHETLHIKCKKTKDHTLTSLEGVSKQEIIIKTKKLLTQCEKHKDESLKFSCECGQLICRDCALNEHKDHEYRTIEEIVSEERAIMKDLIIGIHNRADQVVTYLNELDDMIKNIEEKYSSQSLKIEEAGKRLKNQIDKRIAVLVKEIEERKKVKLRNLNLQKEYWNDLISRAKMNNIESVEHVDDISLLRLRNLMEQKHKVFQSILKVRTEIGYNDNIQVHLEDKDLISSIGEWGNLEDEDVFIADHYVISSLNNVVFVNKETQFLIESKSSSNENVQYVVQPSVQITDAKQQNLEFEIGYSELESLFKVNYIPLSEGLLTISVTIDGKHLKNSPFSVHVLSHSQEPEFKFKDKFGSYGSNTGQFHCPLFVATDRQGDIYVSDYKNHRVQIFDSSGTHKEVLGSEGTGDGQFICPMGITFNSKKHLIIADQQNHRVQVFDEKLQFIMSFGSEGKSNGQFNEPCGIAVDANDNIIVVDSNNHRIQIFNRDGTWKHTFGKKGIAKSEFDCPWSVAVSKIYNRIFVSDSGNNRVQVFDSDGTFLFSFGDIGPEDGHFEQPRGIALTNCHQYLLICDWAYHRIQVCNSSNGSFIKSYGSKGVKDGQFEFPEGICVSPSGQIIITEWENNRVQIFQ